MYKLLQQQVQLRMLLFLLVALISLLITASYLYVIKQPFLELRLAKETLESLENEVKTGTPLQTQIDAQQQLLAQLHIKLHGAGPRLPMNKMVAYVIGELDKIADRHRVHLGSVTPEKPETVFTFQELPFQVEISGDYFSLFAWIKEVESVLGPIVIKQFDISSVNELKERKMTLTIVAYQFEAGNEH